MTRSFFRSTATVLVAALITTAPLAQAYGQAQPTEKKPEPQPTGQAQPVPPHTTYSISGRDYSNGRSQFPNIFGPYAPIGVEPPDLANSPRVGQLIKDGKLSLTMQDAITLALENNLDIGVQRYNPFIAATDILRTKGGGAGRGLAGTGTASALGTIPSQTFDPVFTSTLSMDHRRTPVNNPLLSGTGAALTGSTPLVLTNHNLQANLSYSQGFHTGTAFAVASNNTRASTTSPAVLFNPSTQSTINVSFTQQLLNGFGLLANTRFIRIAQNSKKITDYQFAQQVITSVSQVQNLYWELVFAREDVKVKQRSVALAEKLYNDNKRQVEIGTLAPIEVVRAEAEVARAQQDLIVSQTLQLQQQTLLKNAVTKNLSSALEEVEIVPTDTVSEPPLQIEVVPIRDAVREAWEKRPDVRQAQIDMLNRDINVRATRNALLPTLTLFGQYGFTGLAGNSRNTTSALVPGNPVLDSNGNPVPGLFVPTTRSLFAGTTFTGFTDALGNVFGGDFPSYTLQFSLNVPIRNRPAQADNVRAQLERRQAETSLKRLENSVFVDVRNTQIALEQSRARVAAAQKARILQEQTLDAEQKKFQLGASTIFFVIQAQRDLAQAQSTEVRALVDLVKARIDFERALGRTLDVNRITISDAKSGEVHRDTLIPGTLHGELIGERQKF